MEQEANGERISLWGRIYGVIWGGPAAAMENIIQRPVYSGSVAVILGANLALTAIQLPKIKEFTAWTLQNLPSGLKLTAPQMDVAVNAAVVSSLAASVVIPPIMWLIVSALLKLFNLFTGEKSEFRQLFAVSVFANLPVVIGGMVKAALVLSSPAQSIASVTISPALFLPPPGLDPGKMYSFLSQFDPFVIWSLALTALGGALAMRISFGKTFAYIGSLWFLYILGVTFLTSMGRL